MIDHTISDEDLRAQWAAIHASAVGLSARGPKVNAYLLAVVTSPADLGNPKACAAALEQSSCALRARRVIQKWLLDAGLQPIDLLEQPYREGAAVEDVETIGHMADAWRGADRAPLLGDLVTILGPTHVFGISAIDGQNYTSVQGGERDASGGECIAELVRRFYAGRIGHFGQRPLYGSIDVVAFSRWAIARG